jgi:SAM-dependent methyltransferase
MLINYEEYKAMYEAEEKLWWYRILHEKVLNEIQKKFHKNKQIKILDAGCGTGGLMNFLIKNGYENIQGFDYSVDAVNFCTERNLSVLHLDITNFETIFENQSFDVIISNDVVYQFEDSIIKNIFSTFHQKIKPTGILITNNNAFKIFYGTHDIAVGGKQRFSLSDFENISQALTLKITYHSYWSVALSPLILAVRLLQQLQLKLNLIDPSKIKSDVDVPSDFINNLLYRIVKTEEKVLGKGFFGSSLFLIIEPL